MTFDYESKPFGIGKVRTLLWYIPALKLKYCIKVLKKVRDNGRVLEIGCGGGSMTKAIKYYCPKLKIYGSDISRLSLSFAKKDSKGVIFSYADIYKLPFKNNSFDAVINFDVFEHLDNIPKALSEIKKILKPKGILHIAVPYEGSLANIEGWLNLFGWKAKEVYCGHINKFSIGEIEKIAEKHGFQLIKRRFSDYLISQLADIFFFSFISIRRKNFPYQVEGYVSSVSGFQRNIIFLLKSLFAVVSYIESIIFSWLPGFTGHLTFKKK